MSSDLNPQNTSSARQLATIMFTEVGSMRGVGVAILGLAATEVIKENYYKAAKIAGTAKSFSEQEGILNPYSDNFVGKEYMDELESSLSVEEWKKVEAEWAKLTVDEVLDLVKTM